MTFDHGFMDFFATVELARNVTKKRIIFFISQRRVSWIFRVVKLKQLPFLGVLARENSKASRF